MPEGHTLRRLADDLSEAFVGRTTGVTSPQGRFTAEAALLDGTVLRDADSAGKHLFLEFDGDRVVHVHLGLYGSFAIATGAGADPVPEPVGQVRLRMVAGGDGRSPSYADLRGATRCDLVTPEQRAAAVARLGPDPLRPDADPEAAWKRISTSGRAIGELLMDQTVIAGVGNVYRAEVLYRHRLHPLRPGRSLRRQQLQAMWDDLVVLMADGVRAGHIDTVRPEHGPEATGRPPRTDGRGGEVYVYRRHDQPCHVCRSTIRTGELAGRNTYWCPRCQPAFRSRAKT